MRRIQNSFALVWIHVELGASILLGYASADDEQHISNLDINVMLAREAPHIDLDRKFSLRAEDKSLNTTYEFLAGMSD